MTKSQQKQVYNQSIDNSKQDQANAQTAFGGVQSGIGEFNTGIGSYQSWLNQTYGPGGTFLNNAKVMGNDVAQAGESSLNEDLNRNAERTGANTANFAPTEAEATRANARDLTSFNAKEQQEATTAQNQGNQFVVGEESKIPQMWESAYNTSTGAADNSLNTAQKAGQTPDWWQTALNYAAEGGADYAKVACWIAEAIWSPTDTRVVIVRAWLNTVFIKRPMGRVVMFFYRHFGRAVAWMVRRSPWLRESFRPLFTRVLNQALAEIE